MAESLARADELLEKAERILREVYSIGVWWRADDCSDNRRRRKLVREADWEVSAAGRELAALQPKSEALAKLERDVSSLVAVLEPLPDTVSDIMADDDPQFDLAISGALQRIEALRERCRELSSSD